MRLGFVGTGFIGSRLASRLLEAGHELFVFDVRREATTKLCEMGAHWADSPAAVAEASEGVFTSLRHAYQIEQVVWEPETGVLAGMQPGGTFIDMSTSTPSMAKKIDAAFREKGCNSLDAPVSIGGVFVTVGGDKEVFDRFRPAFEVMHEHVLYMGLAGQGHVAKLCRQYIGFIGSFSVMEALLIAAKAGADMPAMVAFLSDAVGQPAFRDRRLPKALQGDYGTPETATGKLDIVAKDIRLAVELAREVQAPASIGLPVLEILERAMAQGWAELEWWSGLQVVEQAAGMKLRVEVPAPEAQG